MFFLPSLDSKVSRSLAARYGYARASGSRVAGQGPQILCGEFVNLGQGVYSCQAVQTVGHVCVSLVSTTIPQGVVRWEGAKGAPWVP